MMNRTVFISSIIFTTIVSLLLLTKVMCSYGEPKKMMSIIDNKSDIITLFPKNPQELENRVNRSIADAQQRVDRILAIADRDRTFANTARELDMLEAQSDLAVLAPLAGVIAYVDPKKEMREAAEKSVLAIEKFATDKITNNTALYNAFKAYVDGNAGQEVLSDEQKYYLQERMKEYKRSGLHLPEKELAEVKALKNKLTELGLKFEKNINDDARTIKVKREDLAGLPEDFINALKRSEDGLYILGVDYPTYYTVIDYCDVADTRKKLYQEFQNRAYPVNDGILKEMIGLRDELARLLGFGSFAELDLDSQMAKDPLTAQQFLNELLEKVQIKEAQEYKDLIVDLPPSVTLSPDGKFYPWDIRYAFAQYKKKHFDIDEQKIAEYFPMEKTIAGLFDIYQKFLGLNFKHESIKGLWHEEVSLIEARDKRTDALLGYLLLDLYPRPNKFSHACHAHLVSAVTTDDNIIHPSLAIIIANFPKSTSTKPSLLKRDEVETFFHEFGHAMHSMLGRTTIASCSGTNVKTDFVEVPSQMFEEWMRDKDILKMISNHYQTGKSLSDELLDNIIAAKKLSKGWTMQRQIFLARISLDYYKEGAQKNIDMIMRDLHDQICLHQLLDPKDHRYASFGHLVDYGARYYSYLWSQVFAIDLFAEIKKYGLLNQEIGKRLISQVLGKGGCKDPHDLLVAFLGREPNQKNFLVDMGLVV